MTIYDEKSDKYIPLKSDKQLEIDESDKEFDSENDYLQDFTPFTLEEPTYITNGAKDKYSLDLSDGMRTKASSKAVRKIIYRFIRWYGYWVIQIKKYYSDLKNKQKNIESVQEKIEERQANLEGKFKRTVANITADTEVIVARKSKFFGEFTVLDDRLENIERIIRTFVPVGCLIKIKRQMDSSPPIVLIREQSYALGLHPLGLEPAGLFGGTVPNVISSQLVSWTDNELIVRVPEKYEDYTFLIREGQNRYILSKERESLIISVSGGHPIGDEGEYNQVTLEQDII